MSGLGRGWGSVVGGDCEDTISERWAWGGGRGQTRKGWGGLVLDFILQVEKGQDQMYILEQSFWKL